MKKICIALAILIFATSAHFAKRNRAFGPAHRANKVGKGKKDCSSCETQHAECVKNAANPQAQTMCTTMKQNCRKSSGC
jgi:hypothetical protein